MFTDFHEILFSSCKSVWSTSTILVEKPFLGEEYSWKCFNLRCGRCRWFDGRWIRSNPLPLCIFFRFLFGNPCFFVILCLSKHCHSICNGGGFWSSARHAKACLASWGCRGSLVPWMRWGCRLLEHWSVAKRKHHATPPDIPNSYERSDLYKKISGQRYNCSLHWMSDEISDNVKSLMHNHSIVLTSRYFWMTRTENLSDLPTSWQNSCPIPYQ